MIVLDGSEGGGQMVRTALALSTITGKPFSMANIRKGRPNPGLKSQHLCCIKALEKLCSAKAENAALGSQSVSYWPGRIQNRTVSVDIGTAGSITLLLQSLVLPALFARVRLRIVGGTDVAWSMPSDYFSEVFLPQLRRYADVKFSLMRRGYYPKGAGRVDIKVKPKQREKMDLMQQGELASIKGVSHASLGLEKSQVAERQASAAKHILKKYRCPVQIQTSYSKTESPGSGITLWASFQAEEHPIIIGADSLGKPGKRAEAVGSEAAEQLKGEIDSGAPVDYRLADSLVPLIGLFGGRFKTSRISEHTRSNISVVEKFLDAKFKVDDNTIMLKRQCQNYGF